MALTKNPLTQAIDYGLDISTFASSSFLQPDIDPSMPLITGNRVVAEAIARRLLTRRGKLIGSPNYGIDVRDFLNAAIDTRQISSIQGVIQTEVEKEERVETAVVGVTFAGERLTTDVRGATADGPFELVLNVSAVTVELLAS